MKVFRDDPLTIHIPGQGIPKKTRRGQVIEPGRDVVFCWKEDESSVGFGSNAGAYGGAQNGGGDYGGAAPISMIEELNPYTTRWTIKARVTKKGEMRTWQNPKGEGKLFDIQLLDKSG